MAKKNVVIRYLRSEFITSSVKEPSGTLASVLADSFTSERFALANKRMLSLGDLSSSYLLVPEYRVAPNNSVYGLLIELSDVKSPLLSTTKLGENTIDIEELYKEIADEGQDSQTIKNVCYFFVDKNHLIVQSTKGLGPKDFTQYFNWLIAGQIGDHLSVVLKTPINNHDGVISQVKEIQIADLQMVHQQRKPSSYLGEMMPTTNRDVEITKKDLIRTVLSLVREEGNLPDYIPDELIKVSLKLTVDNRKWQKHKEEDKIKEALEVNCRNISDDVIVRLQNGSVVSASELQFRKSISLEHTLSNHPDATTLLEAMQSYLSEIRHAYAY